MSELRDRAITSVVWKFLERFLAQGISLVVSIVIARILIPEDYAIVSLVTIFFTFSNTIISGGLNTSLIQKKDADEIDYSTVTLFSVIVSILIYAVLFLLAPIISSVFDQPNLTAVMRVMGLILPVNAIKSIWCAYISSTLQFRKFFFATLGGTLFSGVVGIAMAINGFGCWALVAQNMINTFLDTIILIITTPIAIRLYFDKERFKELFQYGWKILVSSLLATTYSEISPLIIGLKFNSSDLSAYDKGRSFPQLISTSTTNTLAAVLFPVLSKCQDDKYKVLKYTRLFIRISSFIMFPLMIGLFAVAEQFVSVILTDKWLIAVPYIRIFCICCMFDVVAVGNCESVKAIGKSGTFLIMEIIKKTLYFLIILFFMIIAESPIVLAFSSIACVIVQLIVNSIPNQHILQYRLKEQIFDLIPSLFSAVVMGGVVYLFGKLDITMGLLLILQITLGALIYLVMSVLINRDVLIYTLNLVKHTIFKKRGQ